MIQRKSELVKLVVEVAADRSVTATATYASGAWDGEKQEWVGQPHMVEEPFNSFAHDVSRLKGMVGPMLMQVGVAHENLKKEHAAEIVAHGTTRFDKQTLGELHDSLFRRNVELIKENRAIAQSRNDLLNQLTARPARRSNPLLHRLTFGRAGR